MATFGRFETVREMHRTGYTTVYAARAPESAVDKFVIKVFQPPSLLVEGGQAKTEIDLFLKSTKFQQKVVAGGAQHWASILQHGSSPEGAFYVTEKYEHSLQQLIDVRLKLSSKNLVAIVESVAKGLMELQELCGRPHGNLKATNVLIGGTGDLAQKKIVLCDPLSDVRIDTDVHRDNDLWAIAELIYKLVVHQQPPRVDGWQAPDSKEWRSLGKQAIHWRNLCNRLLNAHVKPGTITIEILLDELAQLKKAKPVLSPRRLIAAAIIIAVCAVALVIFLPRGAPATIEQWEQLCKEYSAWMRDLFQELGGERIEDNPKAKKWRENEYLEKLVKNITTAGRPFKFFTKDHSIEFILGERGGDGETKNALAAIKYIKSFFDADSNSPWPLLLEMNEAANRFETRGWKKPASYLVSLVYSVRPEPNQPIAENVDKILDLREANTLEEIESSRNRIAQYQETIKSSNDPIFVKFDDEYVDREVTSIVDEDDGNDLSRLQIELEEIANLGRKLADFVSDPNWPQEFRIDLLAVDQSPLYNKSILTTEDFEHWLREVMRYKKLVPDPRIDETLVQLKKNIETAKSFQPEKADVLDKELKQEIKNIAAIRQIPSITMYQDKIKKMTFDCLDTLKKIDTKAVALIVDPIEWWEDIEKTTEITQSNVTNAEWCRRRDLELSKYKKTTFEDRKNFDIFRPLMNRVDQTRNRLENLNKTLSPNITPTLKQTDWNTQFDDLYQNKREIVLGWIIGEMAQLTDIPDPNSFEFKNEWTEELSKLKDWQGTLGQLVAAFHTIQERLDICFLLDDKSTQKDRSVRSLWEEWKDTNILNEINTILAKLTQRIKVLLKIERFEEGLQLVDIATTSNSHTEAVYAAWIKLGDLRKITWPNDFEDVNKDRAIRATLKTEFDTIGRKDKERGITLLKTLAGTGIEREIVFIEKNSSKDKILAEFRKLAAGENRPDALSELDDLEGLAKKLADFVSSEDWQTEDEVVFYKTLFVNESNVHKTGPMDINYETFEKWLTEINLYHIIKDPRDPKACRDTFGTIDGLISNATQTVLKKIDFISERENFKNTKEELKVILNYPPIKKYEDQMKQYSKYWEKLLQHEESIRLHIKPDRFKFLDFSGKQIVFNSENLRQFKPIIKKSNAEPQPLEAESWDALWNRTNKQYLGDFADYFDHYKDDNDQSIALPKYIRSTSESKEESVILRFIPAGNSNSEPFYMAIREITNAQYMLFLKKITAKAVIKTREWKFLDPNNNEIKLVSGPGLEDQSRACKIEWDKTSFIVTEEYKNFPVTWVTYAGAELYANWLGGQLPTALQHEYACRAGTNTTYPWGNDPCRIPSYAHVAGPYLKEVTDEYNVSLDPDNTGSLVDDKPAPAPIGAIKPEGFISGTTQIDNLNVVHGEKLNDGSAWPIAGANKPNAWDLYDMIGNVWEWCQDGNRTVICGGSCLAPPDYILQPSSYSVEYNKTDCDVGFRVIVPAPAK